MRTCKVVMLEGMTWESSWKMADLTSSCSGVAGGVLDCVWLVKETSLH